jgi:hypothetical protein
VDAVDMDAVDMDAVAWITTEKKDILEEIERVHEKK